MEGRDVMSHIFVLSAVPTLSSHWTPVEYIDELLFIVVNKITVNFINFLSFCLCLFLMFFSLFLIPIMSPFLFSSPLFFLYLFSFLPRLQGRWKSWKPSGSLAFATMRRMRSWAASWTLTTWRASSTCWVQPWLSASSPSFASTFSTGSSGIALWVSVLASLAWSSPSAE